MDRILPFHWMVGLWSVLLCLSGLLGLVSAVVARRYGAVSLLAERTALTGVGGYCTLYVIALTHLYGMEALPTECVFVFMAAASAWRLWQVQQRVNWLKRGGS